MCLSHRKSPGTVGSQGSEGSRIVSWVPGVPFLVYPNWGCSTTFIIVLTNNEKNTERRGGNWAIVRTKVTSARGFLSCYSGSAPGALLGGVRAPPYRPLLNSDSANQPAMNSGPQRGPGKNPLFSGGAPRGGSWAPRPPSRAPGTGHTLGSRRGSSYSPWGGRPPCPKTTQGPPGEPPARPRSVVLTGRGL